MDRKRRLLAIEQEAARRCLNGNGSSADLPPLPLCNHEDVDISSKNSSPTSSTANIGISDNDDKCKTSSIDTISATEESDGLGTLFQHRYGALPFGNIYLEMGANVNVNKNLTDGVRKLGLGSPMRVLNDDQLLIMLSFLDGSSLGQLVCCSRFLYVAAHHDELWRDLTLRKYDHEAIKQYEMREEDDNSIQENKSKNDQCHETKNKNHQEQIDIFQGKGKSKHEPRCKSQHFYFQNCWKDTFVSSIQADRALIISEGNMHNISSSQSPSSGPFQPHKPIKMKGIYSDTFFRSWLCRSFTLHPSMLSTNNVPIETSSLLTTQRFLEEYEIPNKPVIIRGASRQWPAIQKWSQKYLIDVAKDSSFRATSTVAPLPATFTIHSYANYCNSTTEEAPLYLFDRTFDAKCPTLLQDYQNILHRSCPYFNPRADHGHDLFSLLGETRRPDHKWLIMGPKRSGSAFHIDPNATHAWNATILGRKRWIFYPPGIPPPGVYPSPNGEDVIMPISLGEWFLTHWNDHLKQRHHPDKSKRPLECTAYPGDVLFVPHGWWHCVLNLDDGLNVALTQNYVSASNLPDVLRFLQNKQEQISGCRDRKEAIQPDELLHEFIQSLQLHRPDLLQKALPASKKGYQCLAWNDDFAQQNLDPYSKQSDHGNKKTSQKQEALGTSVLQRAKISRSDSSSNSFSFSFL